MHPLHKSGFDYPDKWWCRGVIRTKFTLEMDCFNFEALHVFGKWDLRIEAGEGKIPGVQIIQFREVERPVTLFA
jgi:hypothetical protein